MSIDKELEALRKFKEYVHKRLDDAGIATHPEGEHSKYGCRIGDRLDIALVTDQPVECREVFEEEAARLGVILERSKLHPENYLYAAACIAWCLWQKAWDYNLPSFESVRGILAPQESDAIEAATWKYEELRKDSAVTYAMSEAIGVYKRMATSERESGGCTMEMCDRARGFIMGIDLNQRTFEQMRAHLAAGGYPTSPYIQNTKGHITKRDLAYCIYELMTSDTDEQGRRGSDND